MKVFEKKQIYAADKHTLTEQGIKSIDLMERAALALFNWLHQRMQGSPVVFHIFCGIGNNGGDGLALARHMIEHGYSVEVYIVNYSTYRSEDFLENLSRLKDRKVWPKMVDASFQMPAIHSEEVIIDAIFGIGLNRPPSDWVSKLIQNLNGLNTFILSIDIPSGLYMDEATADTSRVIKASMVLSFQFPKLVFFLPDTHQYCPRWEVLDIGLSTQYIANTQAAIQLIDKNTLLKNFRYRGKFSHKGSYGHSLIIGGSYGKIGAVLLAGRACIGSGSGLVTVYTPKCGYIPLQSAVPELMVLTDKGDKTVEAIDFQITPTVIGIGMGLGTSVTTVHAFAAFLDKSKTPLVIDADGLNILSENKDLLKKLAPETILTPHPGELRRLIGDWQSDFDKLDKARQFSKDYSCILVLKDAHTMVVRGDKTFINTTGNPGMATAGSGDVLTGIITSLVAQGYQPLNAAILGVYLHGNAGDLAAYQIGFEALTASSICDNLGKAFQELIRKPTKESKG